MVFVLKINLIWYIEWYWVLLYFVMEDWFDVGKILLLDFKVYYIL